MGAADYRSAMYQAVGLPDPETAEQSAFHHIGEWEPHENGDAIDAVVTRRINRIRAAIEAAQELDPEHRALIEAEDFFSYHEYLQTLRRKDELGRTLQRLHNLERRQEFDHEIDPDKPRYYADHTPPTQKQAALLRNYDPERHTPDRKGYLAYVSETVPEVAKFFFDTLPALIPEEDREMHTYITGSSGSGKSEFMKVLIHSYARQEQPPCLVVLDPHGKFADEVAAQKEIIAAGRLIYVNPALSEDRMPSLNPFELDDPKAAGTVAAQLLGVFDQMFRGASHAGLTGNMFALLMPCITALLKMPNTNLLTLQQLFSSKPKDALFQTALKHMPLQQQGFIAKEWDKKRYETTKDAVIAKIQTLMNSDHFLHFLCGESTINLDEAIQNRKTLCFSLQKGELDRETVSTIGSFVVATLQGYVLRKYKTRKHNMIPIHVFVDECHNFLSPSVEEILVEARKFGLHMTLAQQYAGQKMDPDLSKTVLGNTAVKIAGFNDEKATHREMARLMSLEEEQMIGLPKKRFYVKSSDKTAVKLIPPSHLVNRRNCVDDAIWQAEMARQLEAYYRPLAPEKLELDLPDGDQQPTPNPDMTFV